MKGLQHNDDRVKDAAKAAASELLSVFHSCAALADAMDVSGKTVYNILSGEHTPSAHILLTLNDLALRYGIDHLAVLFCGEDYMPVPRLQGHTLDGELEDELAELIEAMGETRRFSKYDKELSARKASEAQAWATRLYQEALYRATRTETYGGAR